MATIKVNPNQHMCVVTIDFVSVLLPSSKGVKLVELLRDAVLVDKTFHRERTFSLRGEVSVEYETAKASQLRTNGQVDPEHKQPLRLTSESSS